MAEQLSHDLARSLVEDAIDISDHCMPCAEGTLRSFTQDLILGDVPVPQVESEAQAFSEKLNEECTTPAGRCSLDDRAMTCGRILVNASS